MRSGLGYFVIEPLLVDLFELVLRNILVARLGLGAVAARILTIIPSCVWRIPFSGLDGINILRV